MRPAVMELRPPGPPDLGFVPKLGVYYRFATDAIGLVGERFDRYGDVYFVPGAPDGLYVLKHPEHLYQVLVERAASFDKGHTAFERMSEVLGGGLLTSDGDTWRRHRRMLQPAFQKAKLVAYASAMAAESDALERRWKHGATVDMSSEMMALTLAIVSRTLFSHDVRGESDDVASAMAAFQDSITRPDLLPGWLPSPGRRRLERAVETLDDLIYRLIRERRRARERGQEHDDLLEMLVAAVDDEGDGQGLTEREIRDELVTLFLAGHETTAQTLTWTFYLLSQFPEVERRLHAELDGVLAGRVPSYEDLERLPYTDQVIAESLRLYPPAYMVARRAREDTRVGDWEVRKGSELALWIFMTQRDPRFYDQPLAFRPERMAPESRAALPRGAYLPFGLGPRTCIGKVFAMIEAKIALATLAQRFRAELAPRANVELRPRITLTPKHGMPMVLQRRG
jgi:cytochrome P450